MRDPRNGTRQHAIRCARVRTVLRLVADHQPVKLATIRKLSRTAAACMTKYSGTGWLEQSDDGAWSLTSEGQAMLAKHEAAAT